MLQESLCLESYLPSPASNAPEGLEQGCGVPFARFREVRRVRSLNSDFMTQINRSLLCCLGLLTLFGAAQAQDFRPNRAPLPSVSLRGEMAGEAAITALADQLPAVARHYG